MSRLQSRDLLLLALLTLFWGVNWPVMKLGVAELPPLYFRTLCLGGGLVVIGTWARFRGISLVVPRGAWREIIWLAIPNMIVWHVLAIQAIKMLPSGRAAILGYTMPVWAVLAGLAFFGEKPLVRHWFGVLAALLGTLLLLSSEFTALAGSPLGTVLMLIAAAAWGFGTHLMRRHLIDLPIITLTFWMMALTVTVMLLFSITFEFDRWRQPTLPELFPLFYNIFFAVAFCHVVWSMLARKLPPAASGLSVMLIPVLGVFSGMWILGEQPRWQDYAALVLILMSLMTVLLPARGTR
ncbi:MAG TPA: EamA family transporter [Burkholderiaceae bacterium]|nr:EamA family transporter [Burkholderiaceae bacterium]HQR70305.1 EamA family transporter [Burkholderiaceae bacterium]